VLISEILQLNLLVADSFKIILQRPHLNRVGFAGGDGFGGADDAGQGGVIGNLLHHRCLADRF
jgi:hypothetical protein